MVRPSWGREYSGGGGGTILGTTTSEEGGKGLAREVRTGGQSPPSNYI